MNSAPVRSSRAGALLLALLLAMLILGGALLRLVRVESPQGDGLVWLWAWQECRVEFINSYTRRPVLLRFGAPWRFSGFVASTDAGTEEYYTAGAYAWNQRLAVESTRSLQYCSEVGLTLTLGGRSLRQQGGCLTAHLIWPP